jgi:hypothetical protein
MRDFRKAYLLGLTLTHTLALTLASLTPAYQVF